MSQLHTIDNVPKRERDMGEYNLTAEYNVDNKSDDISQLPFIGTKNVGAKHGNQWEIYKNNYLLTFWNGVPSESYPLSESNNKVNNKVNTLELLIKNFIHVSNFIYSKLENLLLR